MNGFATDWMVKGAWASPAAYRCPSMLTNASPNNFSVLMIDTATGATVANVPVAGFPNELVVSADGTLIPPAEFDHFWGHAYSAPVHSWLICRPCHQELNNDQHLTWYYRLRARFRRYQAAAEAYTTAFGRRTPARMHAGKSGQRRTGAT